MAISTDVYILVVQEHDRICFYPSQSNFFTVRSGLESGMNLTPLPSGFGFRMFEFTAPIHRFSPLLVSVRCLKIWTGLQIPLLLLLLIAFIYRYSPLSSRLNALACDSAWVNSFSSARFWISTEAVYLQRWHGWCYMKLLPSRRVLCTPYKHAPCHFMQSHTRKVHACLAVTCHLHFWQNDRDLLRAPAVARGWNVQPTTSTVFLQIMAKR